MNPKVSVWLWIHIDLALLDPGPDPELFCEMTNNSHPRLSKKCITYPDILVTSLFK